MRWLILALRIATPAFAQDLPIRPDPTLTPGAVDPAVTQENIQSTICRPGYTKTVRHTPGALKAEIYREYGIDRRSVHAEVDHRVPLEAGGADVKANLWIESYDTEPLNAHRKDELEDLIHRKICSGEMSLKAGQAVFLGDWVEAYRAFFGGPTIPLSAHH